MLRFLNSDELIVRKISELGFEPGIIYEVIVTSLDRHGKPHAGTMGALFEKTNERPIFKIKAYSSCKTGMNLLSTRQGVLNIADPELLVDAALDLCTDFEYVESNVVEVPRLSEALAWIEFKVINAARSNDSIEFTCLPVYAGCLEVKPRPYTRAVFALVEAAVHASRIKPYRDLGCMDKASELYELAKKYLELVENVAPNSRYALRASKIREKYL